MKNEFNVERENELIIKAQQGDLAARREIHKIFNRALNEIVNRKYVTLPVPLSAIRMEAEQIFDKAINSYRPEVGVRPMTYIRTYVEKKITRYVNDISQPVRAVEKHSLNIPKFNESVSFLSTELGRSPTDTEIFTHMKKNYPKMEALRVKDVQRIRNSIRTTSYGSSRIGKSDEGTGLTVEDITFSQGTADPMGDYIRDLKAMEIKNKVMGLPEPHRTIVLHTYAFQGYPKLSLRDLALKLGINKYRVQAYLKEAEVMLRDQ